MARIELEITGNATGLENASKKAAGAVSGLTKATSMSKAQIEAWDAAARRNTMEQYGNDVKRAANNVNNLSQAQRKLTGTTQGLTTGFRSANNVGIEFSRIIQDAPYGIIGVGNNITQLTQSFASLRAQSTSTGAALKTAFTSMFSGANLLVLGVSLATTAWTLYSQSANKARKETEELDNGTKRYIDTLEGVARAQADGQQSAEKDLTNLRLLYEATQNLTLPMESRRKAAQQLIDQYPKQFQGLSQEAILAGQAASAYDRLSQSILATAAAMASVDRIRENSNKILDRRLKVMDLQNKANDLSVRIERQMQTLRAEQSVGQEGLLSQQMLARMERERAGILKEINSLGSEMGDLTAENTQLQGEYNKQISEGADLSGKVTSSLQGGSKTLENAVKLADSLRKLQQESIQASLSGYAKELQASQYKYDELRRQADEYYRQGKVSAKEYADYIARLQGFRVGEAGRIIGPAQAAPLGGGLNKGPSSLPVPTIAQTAVVDLTTNPVWDDFVDDLDKQLGRAVSSFGRDFMRTLTTINQQANVTFGSVVSGIIGSLTGGITEVMSTVFSKQLGDAIQGAFGSEGLGKSGTAWAAGGALLGSIVSGSTSRTSVGGQALGGALTGAGTGAALGSVVPGLGTAVGAVVGAVVGALGGIFGASSARKQEKAQEAMLAEQRKQTALLERQNALTYASSIIGQMTSGGIVSGLMRDAFGQLVATVKGSDLQFVLQRAGGSR